MERVDAANLAEVVPSSFGMKLVLGQCVLTCQQTKLALVYLDHECVLLLADRTIAGRQLREVSLDLKAYGTAVATALKDLDGALRHGSWCFL
jgi:hypothetical protein